MKQYQKEVIKAWLDGETVQYQLGSNCCDCNPYEDAVRVFFNDDIVYRIKPKNIVTTTLIEIDKCYDDKFIHSTFTNRDEKTENLKLTWSPDGKILLKAEVI